MKLIETLAGRVAGLHVGQARNRDLSKAPASSITLVLDGIEGDNHQGFSREAFAGDKEPEGTVRRNERQWSGVSVEELAFISENMKLDRVLQAADLGANLCFEGIPDFSQLPKGSKFTFPSGAKLVAVEYNPPCIEMGEALSEKYNTRAGEPLAANRFPHAAIGLRGLVGVVDVAGEVKLGDRVTVEVWTEGVQANIPRSGEI